MKPCLLLSQLALGVIHVCGLATAFSTTQICIAVEKSNIGDTRIADAAERQAWAEVAKLILEHPTDVSSDQSDGMTSLHWAVYWNHADTVARLIAQGAKVNCSNHYGITPLSLSCSKGHSEITALLLSAGADVNQAITGGETPLMTASRSGDLGSVRQLIQHGANLEAKEHRGQTALMWSAAQGNVQIVEELMQSKANLNASTESGFTALMFAAREGRTEVAMRLIDYGVDVNHAMQPKTTKGRAPRNNMTALMLAVESGHFELALRLVDRGANPNDQRSGFTPLHAISFTRKANLGDDVDGDPIPRGSGTVTSLRFVREIVRKGADVNCRLEKETGGIAKLNLGGATPFLLASRTADIPLMNLLLELGADPKITNVDETTSLMAAAGVGVVAVGEEAGTEPEVIEAIRLLVKLGVDINAVDRNGETAMHGAAYRNFPLAVEVLASLNADSMIWNRKNKHQWTPTLIAEGHRPGSFKPSPETIAALEKAMRR